VLRQKRLRLLGPHVFFQGPLRSLGEVDEHEAVDVLAPLAHVAQPQAAEAMCGGTLGPACYLAGASG